MPSPEQITTFADAGGPPGTTPWVDGATPQAGVEIVDPDPGWPQRYAELAAVVRAALGDGVLALDHVGSTAVPGLPAKPVIDLDLTVADSGDEASYIPQLTAVGFLHVVREPWWYEHRCLRHGAPAANLHVWSPDSPEAARHRIFREWLTENAADRELYAAAKRRAAAATRAAGGHTMDYNRIKQATVREIYGRAFRAAGLIP